MKTNKNRHLSFNKPILLFLLCLGSFASAFAQDDIKVDSLKTNFHKGSIGLLINQVAFNNWLAGGANNFSGTLNLDYQFNYDSKHWDWKTTLNAALGFAKSANDSEAKKTEDRIDFQSVFSRKSSRKWQFSTNINLKTQSLPGYNYSQTDEGTTKTIISDWFSPAYLRLGVGLIRVKKDKYTLQLDPIMTRVILVDRRFTKDLTADQTFFGVKAGATSLWEVGAALGFQNQWKLAKNITATNQLKLVSHYLENPQNVDLDYTFSMQMKVNSHISTTFEVQLLYDDNAFKGLQSRQVFGLTIAIPY